jgi:hypothetical protein
MINSGLSEVSIYRTTDVLAGILFDGWRGRQPALCYFFFIAGSWAGNAPNGEIWSTVYNVGAKTLRRAKERTSLPSLASRSTVHLPTYSSFFFALFPFSSFVYPHYRRRTKIQFRNTPLCIRSAAAPSLTALGSAANRIQSEMLVL